MTPKDVLNELRKKLDALGIQRLSAQTICAVGYLVAISEEKDPVIKIAMQSQEPAIEYRKLLPTGLEY